MIAFAFTFPAGRYHATPWERNANEADVAWPPEPVRILRALIATWWRKADHAAFPKSILDNLVDALAAELPLFRLPEAVHSHVRAYMPAPVHKTLIYDGFFRLDRDAKVIVVWPNAVLTANERALAAHLLDRIGYLGRAESWADAAVVESGYDEPNAGPRALAGQKIVSSSGEVLQFPVDNASVPVDVTVAVPPDQWLEIRRRLRNGLQEETMSKRDRDVACATLPERLADALAVDTSQWHRAGWSSPPPLRRIVYDRPAVGPLPPRHGPLPAVSPARQPGSPEVARFVLAGRPQPRIEDTLRIAEVARTALRHWFTRKGEPVPVELSGRDENGPLRGDPQHAHAFYLPEDADGDGLIDHLIVHCRKGFSPEARRALDDLTKLWIAHGRADEDGERGRREWRLALEDIAAPAAFAKASPLLAEARIWRSATPLLKSRFDKEQPLGFDALVESYRGQIAAEWTRRFRDLPPPAVGRMVDPVNPSRFVVCSEDGRARSTLAFARTRQGRGGRQPDAAGGSFELIFDGAVQGPISLGWGAHFGLGLFRAGGAG